MNKKQIRRMEHKIETLIRQNKLQGRKVYLSSASDGTKQMIRILRDRGIEPVNVLDNDLTKTHSFWAYVKVITIEEIPEPSEPQNIYFVYSKFWREIMAQLGSYGIKKGNIHLLYEKATFADRVHEAFKGKNMYESIVRKYGQTKVFICPYTGTGDIYLIGTFWRQYILRNNIDKYVFLVVNNACKKVAMLFDIRNIEVIEGETAVTYFMSYYRLCQGRADIKILNDSWWEIHTNPLQWFRGYHGLGFAELFRKFVFGLPDNVKPESPQLKDVDAQLEELFLKNHFIQGKTVVLSPYSNTLVALPDEFWTSIAEKLKEKGYIVCTNSGSSYEPAVEGTLPVFFPLDIAPQFIGKAGFFIGIRSGFCDVVSAAKAKKIILYEEKNRFFQCSAFEYFSLKRMGLCEDALELQLHNENCMEYVDGIVDVILRRRMEMECSIG